jgi:hypothetical protein
MGDLLLGAAQRIVRRHNSESAQFCMGVKETGEPVTERTPGRQAKGLQKPDEGAAGECHVRLA